MKINAKGIHYRELNENIRRLINSGEKEIVLDNINGQRYIGDGIKSNAKITINGTPGNDLGAFMDGPDITVFANVQDGTGNTMSSGSIIVHGDAGDILGHSMRGGKLFIKGNAGYRTGIHMKSYKDMQPVIIVGGSVQDFTGEYMAGGLLIIFGNGNGKPAGNYIGTGMHAGSIYMHDGIEDYQLGKEVKKFDMSGEDEKILAAYLKEYCSIFSMDIKKLKQRPFIKIAPLTHRPYGKLYAY